MSAPGSEADAVRLLNQMGYVSEEQLCSIAQILPSTAVAWRKRRKGPQYTRIGQRVVYPLAGVQNFLSASEEQTTLEM